MEINQTYVKKIRKQIKEYFLLHNSKNNKK